MFSYHQIRFLSAAVAAGVLIVPAVANPPKKRSSTSSAAAKTPVQKIDPKKLAAEPSVPSTGKVPPQRIDIAKLEAVTSLYTKERTPAPQPKSPAVFSILSSSYRYDSRLVRAAEIAADRAYAHSHGSCWRSVKNALVSAGVVDSRPKTGYAKEAAYELTNDYGFQKILCTDPFKAPIGSVLVYGGKGAGHIEFRTKTGFVSDFSTPNPSKRPLIGVYVKR